MPASFYSSDHPDSARDESHRNSRRRPRTETSRSDNNGNDPPQWLLNEILDLLESHTGIINTEYKNVKGCDNRNTCTNRDQENDRGDGRSLRWKLLEIVEAKSAQQQVFILRFEDTQTNFSGSVLRESFPDHHGNKNIDTAWSDTMRSGKNRLVLRIWKGGSRWWNLNRNNNYVELAKSEITGYRIAREAFERYYQSEHKHHNASISTPESSIPIGAATTKQKQKKRIVPWMVPTIPRILYFHALPTQHNNSDDNPPQIPPPPKIATNTMPKIDSSSSLASDTLCWAILEYVGADENDILTTTNGCCDIRSNGAVKEYRLGAKIDRSHMVGMIKNRIEFGFEEPHPRWGRVPVDKAMFYARTILHEVLLPLHCYSNPLCDDQRDDDHNKPQRLLCASPFGSTFNVGAKTFSDMVKLYRRAWKDIASADKREKSNADRNIPSSVSNGEGWEYRIEACIQHLDKGICALEAIISCQPTRIPPLSPVLVHLDLQPQNLIFCGKPYVVSADGPQESETSTVLVSCDHYFKQGDYSLDPRREGSSSVFSVLDWEDAAWADPRFDLVLLCRKVCANRDQADTIWCEYKSAIASNNELQKKELGPIEPWLLLETVHSIATILLQSVDLANGGRNPWETKKDLWGKLQREFSRLDGYKTNVKGQCVRGWH